MNLNELKLQLLHALSNMDSHMGLLQQCITMTMHSQLNKMEVMQEEYVKFSPEKIHKNGLYFNPFQAQQTDNHPSPLTSGYENS